MAKLLLEYTLLLAPFPDLDGGRERLEIGVAEATLDGGRLDGLAAHRALFGVITHSDRASVLHAR